MAGGVSCFECPVRDRTLCRALDSKHLTEVENLRLPEQALTRGSILVTEGGPSNQYLTIKRGWVMTYSTLPDGRRQIHSFDSRGALIGRMVGAEDPSPYAVEALTDIVACALPRQQADKLFLRAPKMALELARAMNRKQEHAYELLMSVGRRTARERVAHLLLDLYRQICASLDAARPDQPIALPLTQQHIADALGLTSVHVSRTLTQLRKEGLVSLHHQRLDLLDVAALTAVASGDR